MASPSGTRKKVKKKNRSSRKGGHKVSILKSLPKELLMEVTAKIASNSFYDLCRIRQTCKEFDKAGQEDYIFQHVTIDKNIPLFPLKERERFSEFLKRCRNCGNADALYRQGVIDLFNLKQFDFKSGFECFEKAAARGHKEATYVYGVFLACMGGEAKKLGLRSLSSLSRKDLSESRERIIACLRSMWLNKVVVSTMLAWNNAGSKTCSQCGNLQDNLVTKKGWDDLYDEAGDNSGCESCKMNREVTIFCDILGRV